jgi:hypothetical protein
VYRACFNRDSQPGTFACSTGHVFKNISSGFFGPLVGSVTMETLGFEWTTTIFAALLFVVVSYNHMDNLQ